MPSLRRVSCSVPVADAFYRELCNMTRSEVRERLEAKGDQLVEAGSVKTRRGAVAAALDEITSIEAPGMFGSGSLSV